MGISGNLDRRRQQRRRLLRAVALAPAFAFSQIAVASTAARQLRFSHTHTGEKLSVTYAENGAYLPDALDEINFLLRDFRAAEVTTIDPALLDFLYGIQAAADSRGVIEIISGYRSPATNEMLRRTTSGVARHSFHLKGQAIDVRISDVRTPVLRDAAIDLGLGGVGYYASSDFLHIDLGPVRSW